MRVLALRKCYMEGLCKKTLDHIIPLSHGGPHKESNTQCMCFMCNSTRGDTMGGDQLRLDGGGCDL